MNSLNDAGLEGIVLLPLSNASIAEQDARVVWQSSEKNTVEVKGNRVFVVLDNNFGYEYNPLYKSLGVIDGREWSWSRNNNTVFIGSCFLSLLRSMASCYLPFSKKSCLVISVTREKMTISTKCYAISFLCYKLSTPHFGIFRLLTKRSPGNRLLFPPYGIPQQN